VESIYSSIRATLMKSASVAIQIEAILAAFDDHWSRRKADDPVDYLFQKPAEFWRLSELVSQIQEEPVQQELYLHLCRLAINLFERDVVHGVEHCRWSLEEASEHAPKADSQGTRRIATPDLIEWYLYPRRIGQEGFLVCYKRVIQLYRRLAKFEKKDDKPYFSKRIEGLENRLTPTTEWKY